MFKSKHQLQIELEPTDKPFYTAGDVVSGQVRVFANKELTLTNIQVKLRCEEWSEVAEDDKYRQTELRRGGKRREADKTRRVNGKKEFARHYSSTITVYPDYVAPESHKCILREGEHVFPFLFELPARLESYPPHCPITTFNGLKVGVRWGVKAVIHRPGTLQLNVREIIDVELYPPPKTGDLSVDLDTLNELSGFKSLEHDPPTSLVGRMRAAFSDPQQSNLVATLQYPRQGIPQLGLHSRFYLKIGVTDTSRAPPSATIQRVALVLVQCCETKAKGLLDIYETRYPLGEAKVAYVLKQMNDLTEVLNGFGLNNDTLPPAFETSLLKVWYDLRLEVDILTAKTNAKQTVDQTVSVPLISPVSCWYATHDHPEPEWQARFDDNKGPIPPQSKGSPSMPSSPSSPSSQHSSSFLAISTSDSREQSSDSGLPTYIESQGSRHAQRSGLPRNDGKNSSGSQISKR